MNKLTILLSFLIVAGSPTFAEDHYAHGADDSYSGQTTTLTVEQVVKAALNNPNLLALIDARVKAAKGRYTEMTSWKNPELSYSQESTDSVSKDSNEETYMLSQTFDLSGKKRLNRHAAKLLLNSSIQKTSLLRSRTKVYAKQLFYKALYHKQRVQVINRALILISSLESAVRKRERAGDVSGYHRRRISREKYLVRANLNSEKSQYQNSLNNLTTLISNTKNRSPAVNNVKGLLTPTASLSLDQLLAKLSQRPDLIALQQQAKSEHFNGQAEKRAIIPPLTLGLGYKRVDESNQSLSTGPVVSLSIAIPLSRRRRGKQAKHFSNAQALNNQYSLRLHKDKGRMHGLWLLMQKQIGIGRAHV